jgi:hypothetical protein
MSRSYRKHTRFHFENDSQNKKFANRRVRRSKTLFQNNEYRKVYDSWMIRMGHWGYNNEEEYVEEGLLYSDKSEKELRKQFRSKLKAK